MTLRIQKFDERNRVVLTLIDRIRADQVSELEALLTSVTDYDSVILDLKDVKLVDWDAVLFLARTEDGGSKAQELRSIHSRVDFGRAERATSETGTSAALAS